MFRGQGYCYEVGLSWGWVWGYLSWLQVQVFKVIAMVFGLKFLGYFLGFGAGAWAIALWLRVISMASG